MGSHALLSASSSHRWLNCTPSARLEASMPETQSNYADEGNLAHDIAELKVNKHFTPMGPRTFANKLKKLQEDPLYQDEMLIHTDAYLNYISGIIHSFKTPPYIAVEKKLDYGNFVPEGFGTGDCIIIGGNVLRVIDFKYGKGVPVSAVDNPQMKLYALGAYEAYSFLYTIEKVIMSIFQPRIEDEASEYEITIDELIDWGVDIKPIAQAAYEGKGEFISGEHCRFCKAKARCRARSDFNLSLEELHKMKPPLITNEEVGAILLRAQDLAKWALDLEEYALAECLQGNEIPRWKAVEGRSVRQFTNQDEAFKTLTDGGIQEAMLYERKPITLTAVEKLLGKKEFEKLLTGLITKPPGKPTLVLESDKREAIKRQSAVDDFKVERNDVE